jgi:molybdate transport system ATP-binding protein
VTKLFMKLENVTLNVNDHLLFENTNWLWRFDEQWAIVGPNGSGKSTFAKALCRQISLQTGQIHYFFHNITEGEPFFNRGDILMISPNQHQELMQQYGGYHQARWQSSEEADVPSVSNYLSGKSIEHRSPYEVTPFKIAEEVYLDRRQKAMALLEIEYLLERKIHQLSNGEARKVLIARALMQSPKLLIFDDPFGGLDTESRLLLRKVITEIIAVGEVKILLVASDPAEVPDGITHLLYVADHQVREEKPISQVLPAQCQTEIPFTISSTICVSTLFPNLAQTDVIKSSTLVEMKNTSVRYNGIAVLSNVNWTIKEGQRWALLGHNGAGKSTILSLIMADNPQSYANEIYLFGQRRGSGESIWDIKRQIGWVSPELQMYYTQGYSCLEVVCSGFFDTIGLYQSCSEEQTASAEEWLHQFQMKKQADHPFSSLSLGEQRLTLLARALVKNPALLVLDEPCQGLDESHRKYINNLLDQLCQQTSLSMIYVTHYLDELPEAITHILRLRKGQVIENVVSKRGSFFEKVDTLERLK